MHTTSRRTTILLVVVLLACSIPAAAQAVIASSDFSVATADGLLIHVHRKVGAQPARVPVLLIHGTWTDARVWDFPGRSVMDHLATRGYDVYALDLRGMGSSDKPDFSQIDVLARVLDAAAVAGYIRTTTGRPPVVMGWSQGGIITGLLAAAAPQLVSGIGLLSVAPDGFTVPPQFLALLESVLASGATSYLPSPDVIFAIAFAINPITGQPTISASAFATFVAGTEPDSVNAVVELGSPLFFSQAGVVSAWPAIKVPALVADGGLDVLVGRADSKALFQALGSSRKQLIILPLNAHAWFVEDDHNATVAVLDKFLSQF